MHVAVQPPRRQARFACGDDLGLLNIANTLPQVIVLLSAPAILAQSARRLHAPVCVAGAVMVLGAAVLVLLENIH